MTKKDKDSLLSTALWVYKRFKVIEHRWNCDCAACQVIAYTTYSLQQ